MLISMTGYGTATAVNGQMSVTAEIRSVNSRFYEFSARLPKHLQVKELELKEAVRGRVKRGKVNLAVSVDRSNGDVLPVHVDEEAVRAVMTLLRRLNEVSGLNENINLETLMKFSEVFTTEDQDELPEEEWKLVVQAVGEAADALLAMRSQEGAELTRDMRERIGGLEDVIDKIEKLTAGRSEKERDRLREKLRNLLTDEKIDPARLDMEIALLADKMDITEEMVRFRSHTKFFLEALDADESEGRKLSFLLQEMNREANTIAAKSYDADIAHLVVSVKEELERVREQIQNIE